MVNPPTRPYSEEELKEIMKLLSAKNKGDNPPSPLAPIPSVKPIEIKVKTPVVFENTPPVAFNNNVSESPKSIEVNSPVTNAEKPVVVEGAISITAETKTFFSQYGVWIILGSIVVLVGAYLYWDYQKKKKESEQSKP